jgi:hypothetical protein
VGKWPTDSTMSLGATDQFSSAVEVGSKKKSQGVATVDSPSAPSPSDVGCSRLVPSSRAAQVHRPTGSPEKLSGGSVSRRNRQTGSGASPSAERSIFRAALCEEFLRLRNQGHTLTGAAAAVGLPASCMCGGKSMLARYLRGGVAGLERHGRGAEPSKLSQELEALGWFVQAAKFFYLSASRRRGALVESVRRAAALPVLPSGWNKATRARLLTHLDMDSAPICPEDLRERLLDRERNGKPIVPPRIIRLIATSPANARKYCFEALVGELAQIPLAAVVKRLAEQRPGGSLRLTIELL